jgi:hypothetical protein
MALNREQIIKELGELVVFRTCPEYVKEAFILINELAEENKVLSENLAICNADVVGLEKENERLKKHEIVYETPFGKQTMPDILSLDGKSAELYKRIENKIKADTVRKMHSLIKERCIAGGIYPAFVASTIEKVAKEISGE